MKSIIQNLFSDRKRDIIKQGVYKNVKYEVHKEYECLMWYIEFNEEYIKYKSPVDFQHLEKDYEPQYSERVIMLNKQGKQQFDKNIIPCLRDHNPFKNMHLFALDDLLYHKNKFPESNTLGHYKTMDQILQDIKNSIDGVIKYQKTALKLTEYENKMEYVYNEFHKSISKQEEKHKKDIEILDKEYEEYLK